MLENLCYEVWFCLIFCREMENLQLQIKETEKTKNEVSKQLEEHKQEENVQEIMEDLKQQLKIHLM